VRIPQLRQVAVCPDENFLGDVLRIGVVPDFLAGVDMNQVFILMNQKSKSALVACQTMMNQRFIVQTASCIRVCHSKTPPYSTLYDPSEQVKVLLRRFFLRERRHNGVVGRMQMS
jgi:hypothetical protein